ncbi:MAG TPA: hypothetical protein VGQ29_08495 [Gemmatimonadales bacterium]|jgi:hypothetical protein|nr:hypothetical protein [Gemmatimonadales bacterium]
MTTAVAPMILDTFSARVYMIGALPDADGDVLLVDTSGTVVKVSLEQHDTILQPGLEPAGEARLERQGNAIVARGMIYDTPRGRALRQKLREAGDRQEWSIGFFPLETRKPTAAELAKWPDARRIIERMDLREISPVRAGACGPHCRTLPGKSRGGAVEVKVEVKCGACARLVSPTARAIAECEARNAAVFGSISARAAAECEARSAELKADVPPGVIEVPVFRSNASRDVLERGLEAAARDLKLDGELRVRFFAKDGRRLGFFHGGWPDTVWLSADLETWQALEVLGHELKHLQGHQRGSRASEPEARAYGAKLARSDQRFWPSSVEECWYDKHGARLL